MAKDKTHAIKWLPDVEDHDYPDAESYLRLIFDDKRVDKMMTEFRKVHQFMVFCCNTPIQYALAEFLKKKKN